MQRFPQIVLISFLILLTPFVQRAQAQYRFDSWTTDNGLPQGSVNSILQTRDGYIWLATFGGLVRFDGLRFQVFNTGNTKGMRSGRFVQLFEDRVGNLWMNTEGQGVTRYKDDVFTSFTTENGLPGNPGRLYEDAAGKLRVQTDGGVVQWVDGTFKPVTPAPGEVRRFERTDSGAIWYQEGSFLHKVEQGRITVDLNTGYNVSRFYPDRQGRLWIGTREETLLMYQDGKLNVYSENEGYPQFHLNAFMEDKKGSIWLGSNGKGLFQFKDGHFTTYSTQDGLAGNNVRNIHLDREGTLWVGTDTGLSHLIDRVVTAHSSKDGLAADNVYPIHQDRQGNIWIGSWNGLTRYANGVFTNLTRDYDLADTAVTSLLEDNTGGLWIGAWGTAPPWSCVRYVKDGKVTVFRQDELPGGHVRAIIQDRAGNIWFGTSGGWSNTATAGPPSIRPVTGWMPKRYRPSTRTGREPSGSARQMD